MEANPHVIVVGGGIIGASVAWHLARGGARVTVVEGAERGGLATPRSWAWINASWGHPEPYIRLRMQSMAEWRTLQPEVPGLDVNWCGGLVWDLPDAELRAFVAERAAQGYDIRLVEADEVAALEPALSNPPRIAAHSPAEGAIEPLEATMAILADAERRGARVISGQPVDRILSESGQVVGVRLADGLEIRGDQVVLATGATTATLAAQVGVRVPVDDPAGLLVSTKPVPPLLNGLVVGPGLELRQLRDGRLLGSGHYAGSDPGTDPDAVAAALLDAIRAGVKGGERLELHGYTIGHRPVPSDGLSIIGPAAPGLHVAVTHSGVTLAPVIGRIVAEEILTGRRDPIADGFGLDRFAP
ncbi:NAD(P)/FAD-dependent oxidoreductase [Rubellimicrobium arenae]|uniref:NAD(P)/FAD-dependent oxidoreductase n=1 Tax=Rubellimicrobium arenae TaxID=2817372 RepID=UPI001B313726|nr:FAD-binding oxidoreductase [Rubellimicrobium arenae]